MCARRHGSIKIHTHIYLFNASHIPQSRGINLVFGEILVPLGVTIIITLPDCVLMGCVSARALAKFNPRHTGKRGLINVNKLRELCLVINPVIH
jgi:hypothetical protein